jgi:O-antigen/teichoic acid export membrane protein
MDNKQSFVKAVKWAFTANWGQKGLSSLFVIILASILGPSEYGIVAIATVYVSFLQMFLDQGLMAAIIQREDLRDEHLDAVFWMNQVLAVGLVGVSVILSSWWAAKNHAPAASRLISVLSLDIPLMALVNVQCAILNRRMDFKSLAICANLSALVGGIVGVSMAEAGFRAWSLVGQQLSKDTITVFVLWKSCRWCPRCEFSWKHLKELTDFSISNFIAQLGIFADQQASSVILGIFFGPVALGLYRLTDRIVSSVVNMTMAAIQSVSFPEFARLQHEPEALRKSVLTCIRLTAAITLPALCGLAAVSKSLMASIGPNWILASPVLKLLCMLGVTIVFAFFTGPLLQALSRPRELALLEWARMGVGTVMLLGVGYLVRNSSISWQIVSIAMARFVASSLIVAPVFVYILMRLSRISIKEFFFSVGPAAISAASVVASVHLYESVGWLRTTRPIIYLTSEIVIGGVVGLFVLLGCETRLRRSITSLLYRNLRCVVPVKQSVLL